MTFPMWMSFPPEVHSLLLSSGGGPASLLSAAAAWDGLSAQYLRAQDSVVAMLTKVSSGVWKGESSDEFLAAHLPLLDWLGEVSATSANNAQVHTDFAGAYEQAHFSMPTLIELMVNHIIHAILVATNFFGVNTIPIAINEADYTRMWIQAAETMAVYQSISEGLTSALKIPSLPPPLINNIGIGQNLVGLLQELSINSQGAVSQEFNDAANILADMLAMREHINSEITSALTSAVAIAVASFTPGTPLDFISHMIMGPILTVAIASPGIIGGLVGGIVGGVGGNLANSAHPSHMGGPISPAIPTTPASLTPTSPATTATTTTPSSPAPSASSPAGNTIAASTPPSGGVGPGTGVNGQEGTINSFFAASAYSTLFSSDYALNRQGVTESESTENFEEILNTIGEQVNTEAGFSGIADKAGIKDPLGLSRMPSGAFATRGVKPAIPTTWQRSDINTEFVSTSQVSAAKDAQARFTVTDNVHQVMDKIFNKSSLTQEKMT